MLHRYGIDVAADVLGSVLLSAAFGRSNIHGRVGTEHRPSRPLIKGGVNSLARAATRASSRGACSCRNRSHDRLRRVPGTGNGVPNLLAISGDQLDGHQVLGEVDRDLRSLIEVLHCLGDGPGAVTAGHVVDLEGKHGAFLGTD
jgi:hypothetical protein